MSFDSLSSQNSYDFNTFLEIGSFEYIPRKFLNIDTSTFTDSRKKVNSYLTLKQSILDNSTSFEDKCQGVRYMCHIPYKNGLEHTLECCKNILENENYDLDQRYYFFANNEKYFKLEDHVVFHCFIHFFNICLERNYPYMFTILASKYIIRSVPDTILVNKAKEFLYNISKDVNETIQCRAEAIDTLLEYGNVSDQTFGKKQLETLGDNYVENLKSNIYTNTQNVHNESISKSIRNMLRNLIKEDKKLVDNEGNELKQFHMEDIHNFLINYSLDSEDHLKTINRLLTDPSKYEGKNLSDILILVWRRINSFDTKIQEEIHKRFIEELNDMNDTCSSGHLSRILNILSGFVSDSDYQLKINPKDSLRSCIFARLNSQLRKLGGQQQEEIINALASTNKDDKIILEEYITYYGPKDELEVEYKDLLNKDDFEKVYEQTINEYIGYN